MHIFNFQLLTVFALLALVAGALPAQRDDYSGNGGSNVRRTITSRTAPAGGTTQGKPKKWTSLPVWDWRRRGSCKKSTLNPERTRPPQRMDWEKCRREMGVGWSYRRRCYAMYSALSPTERTPEGTCYFLTMGWVLPPPHPSIPVTWPWQPRPQFHNDAGSSSQKHPETGGHQAGHAM
ncbi:hypothetical protein LshimejAT787_1105480 [Lyophyllum shimeji]|uniref:Uncharacterized protein n=1 Tax=Lyophyllum shimeji TaxID=47721 RepID=A0A9P3URC7_LYOSH|nr:hypothetical protein LshimejAT787_1105480 [Lyophyllum shimeji]